MVDRRGGVPRVSLLSTAEVFTEEFFKEVEQGFSAMLRRGTEQPLSHLMAIPERVNELVRALALHAVLRRIGGQGQMRRIPRVAVLVVTGAALSLNAEQLARAFGALIHEGGDAALVSEWVGLMERLIGEEREALRKLEQQELRQALEGRSERFFTLWERGN